MKILHQLLALLFITVGLSAAPKAPNFILLLSDDQSWNGLSVQMDPENPDSASSIIDTPNLEKLASEGMRFTRAYAPAPTCSPTRISLQTGQSPAQLGWTKGSPNVSASEGLKLLEPPRRRSIEDENTIAEWLNQAGYASAHFGKWHLGGGGPEKHGYITSDGDLGNEASSKFRDPNPVDIFGMGKRAIEFMEAQQAAEKPFFIQMSYHALHSPGNALKTTLEKYEEKFDNQRRRERLISRAAISEDLDTGIGVLLNAIDELGLRENTYIIYMSDNGGGVSALSGGKGSLGEGGIRVPFIIRGPGIPPNSISRQPIVGYDLFPTFSELAGIRKPLPDELEGDDISPYFSGIETPIDRAHQGLLFHFPNYQGTTPCSALILGKHKVYYFYEDQSVELYDLSTDPNERNNLAAKQPERAQSLLAKLKSRLMNVEATLPKLNPQYVEGTTYKPRRGKKPR